MEPDVFSLLFCQFYSLNGNKKEELFKSKRELAEAIHNEFKEEYPNLTSLTVYLSRTIQPKSKNNRKSIPTKLRYMILDVSLKKLANDSEQANIFKERLEKAFEESNEHSTLNIFNDNIAWKQFKNFRDAATEMHIFTHSPSVLMWQDYEQAKEHVADLCSLIHKNYLLERCELSINFYLPDMKTCYQFWQGLRNFMVSEMHLSKFSVDNMIHTADRKSLIQVFQVPPRECAIPVSFLKQQIGLEQNKNSMFYFSFHSTKEISITQASHFDCQFWFENKFMYFISLENENEKRRYHYSSAVDVQFRREIENKPQEEYSGRVYLGNRMAGEMRSNKSPKIQDLHPVKIGSSQ